MAYAPLAVGIVGLQPGRSWASLAHVPALRALPDRFRLIGVANTSQGSANAAAKADGIPIAFPNAETLIASDEIDVVSVTMRVPAHLEVVKMALRAGKAVYCEWPLGRDLAEATEMAQLAQATGGLAVIGTQAIVAPEIVAARSLVADGAIGDVLSVSIVGTGGVLQGGGSIPDEKTYSYLLDRSNGATLLTIPVGHTLAAVRSVLGEVEQVSAVLATRRQSVQATDTGRNLTVTAPDQVLVSAVLASGAPLSLHYRGGAARAGEGLLWEINGTKGDIRLTGPSGHVQMVPLSLSIATDDAKTFRPVEIPGSERRGWPDAVEPGNVARLYARMAEDLRTGSRSAPGFDEAKALHRVIDAIDAAARDLTTVVRS